MRLNIRDIINTIKCTEDHAEKVEAHINNKGLLDWSECGMRELKRIVIRSNRELMKLNA